MNKRWTTIRPQVKDTCGLWSSDLLRAQEALGVLAGAEHTLQVFELAKHDVVMALIYQKFDGGQVTLLILPPLLDDVRQQLQAFFACLSSEKFCSFQCYFSHAG